MKKIILEILAFIFVRPGKGLSLKEYAKRIYLLRVARRENSCKRRLPLLWAGRVCVFPDGTEGMEWVYFRGVCP